MVFSSLTFLFYFLPLTLLACFARRDIKWRNGVLLGASLLFYAWGEPVWVLAMVGSTAVAFLCARKIVHTKKKRRRRRWMALSVALSAAILFIFKYSAFFVNSFMALFGASWRMTPLRLPIGISFYTFQVITYTVDVYRRKARAQKHFPRLMLYISCFPQLIAGPIVQYSDVADQLGKRQTTPDDFAAGMQRFVVGLGKKVIFANVCGKALSSMPLAGGAAALSVGGAWYAAFLYTLQIYFDFSGYSDMAIGLGRILGFSYKENFLYPYSALSVRDFWRKWHVSLGSFFRDYIYIPLGGNRRGLKRTILNTMIVWMLTGLWHGASWSFVLWGLYYGVLLALEKTILAPLLARVPAAVRRIVTFVLVMFGWLLFAADSVGFIGSYAAAMFSRTLAAPGTLYDLARSVLLLAILAVGSTPLPLRFAHRLYESRRGRAALICATVAAVILSVAYMVASSYNPFLYFRF